MSKKSFLDRAMARLGYVPGPAKHADSICSLKIDIDSTAVDVALEKLNKLAAASAEVDSGAASSQLVTELRNLACEIRADRHERAQAMRQLSCNASGLPG